MGPPRLQAHEPSYGLRGPATGEGFQIPPKDDEGGEKGRRLIEHRPLPAEAGLRPDGVDDRYKVCRAYARGIEEVHVSYTMA